MKSVLNGVCATLLMAPAVFGQAKQSAGEPILIFVRQGQPAVAWAAGELGAAIRAGGREVRIVPEDAWGFATTAADGSYLFTGLGASTYTVTVDTTGPLEGYAQTFDSDGAGTPHQSTVPVAAGEAQLLQDFGYQPDGVIKRFLVRKNFFKGACGKAAVPDIAAAGAAHTFDLAHGIGRKVVVQHKGAELFSAEGFDALFIRS